MSNLIQLIRPSNHLSRLLILLCACAAFVNPAHAQNAVNSVNDSIFENSKTTPRGWKPLVKGLEALTPDIDTSLALTPKDITDRITALLDQGQNEAALEAIEKRLKQREDSGEINVDVQLLFLQGRAQSQLGLHNDAIESYRQLTIFYPELPEPWNNLAIEYMHQHKLGLAQEALDMALTANPNYTLAIENQGELYLMLADESFQKASNQERSQETN